MKLTMMVKNEAHVIERCLKSCLNVIDSYSIIVDETTTDDTEAVIRRVLKDLPGEIHAKPWLGFGATRTQSLELARESPKTGYLLVMDADDVLIPSVGYLSKPPALKHDAYELEILHGDVSYRRSLILKASTPWRYEGVAHEALVADIETVTSFLPGLKVKFGGDGSRSSNPLKHRWDAEELKKHLALHPDDARATFYLAQSLRDAGDFEAALSVYLRRAEMGGWEEEVFHSLLQAGAIGEKLEKSSAAITNGYMRAFSASGGTRAEPLYNLACYFREKGDAASAYVYARAGFGLPYPTDARLTVAKAVYDYAIGDELSSALYLLGHKEAAAEIASFILPRAPADVQPRIQAKIDACGIDKCFACRQKREVKNVDGRALCFPCAQKLLRSGALGAIGHAE